MLVPFLCLLVTHFVADFVFQTNWQALNKSTNNIALLKHVLTYTLCLGAVSAFVFVTSTHNIQVSFDIFVVGNGLLHFGTDYVTSRISKKFFSKQDFHNGFIAVGFDQLIHQVTLAATMYLAFYRS